MGWDSLPLYGDDFASAVETAEKIIAKIKRGKATDKELEELSDVVSTIVKHASEN